MYFRREIKLYNNFLYSKFVIQHENVCRTFGNNVQCKRVLEVMMFLKNSFRYFSF